MEEAGEAVLRGHHQGSDRVEPSPYDTAPAPPVSVIPEITEHISVEVRRDVRCEIDFKELFRRIDEENASFENETTDTQRFDVIQVGVETTTEEEPCKPVLRDYDQKRAGSLEEKALELEEPGEPLPYDPTIKSPPKSQSPKVLEHISVEVQQDVRCEINFEEIFRRLDEEDIELGDKLNG